MSKKSTQTSNTKTVTTPTNPEWVTNGMQDVAGKISQIGQLDPSSLIAGINPLQSLAADKAGSLGSNRSYLDALGSTSVNSASLLDSLDSYMSPYRTQVTDAAMADFDANAGRTRAQQDLDLAGSSAFGGSGAALTKSMTEGELSRARNTQLAGLLDQGFNTAAGLSNQDAQRRQAASEANASLAAQRAQLGLAAEQSDRANIGSMFDLGSMLREIEAQQRNAPVSLAATQAGLLSGLPLNLFQGQEQTGNSTTTSKTSDPMGALGSLAMLAAAPLTGGTSLLGMGLGGLGLGGAGLSSLMGAAGATAAARR